jgi:hypothetical protein
MAIPQTESLPMAGLQTVRNPEAKRAAQAEASSCSGSSQMEPVS